MQDIFLAGRSLVEDDSTWGHLSLESVVREQCFTPVSSLQVPDDLVHEDGQKNTLEARHVKAGLR